MGRGISPTVSETPAVAATSSLTGEIPTEAGAAASAAVPVATAATEQCSSAVVESPTPPVQQQHQQPEWIMVSSSGDEPLLGRSTGSGMDRG